MAESKKGDSSASVKKKDGLEDLDIGNNFFTSWKSMSMAEEDGLDFDLAPSPKGNKKPFDFDKADMDFNLDGDFGKISSFNMDMSDLDISPTLEKDGKSKEKSKESSTRKDKGSSFNMDMSDLDFSVPLKKERKEKPKDSSGGKSKGKEDHFAFTFDFDEIGNFSFDSSLETEHSKAQKDKNKKEGSPDGSGCQDKEVSMHLKVIGSTSTKEDGPKKPSLPESRITFYMDCLAGENADLEPTRKTSHSNLAVDDAVTAEYSAATKEVASDKAKHSLETTLVSNELPNNSQSVELVSPGLVELEACTRNDAMQELSSDYPSNIEPSGSNSSETQNQADFMHKNATGPDGEQDANMNSVAGSTRSYENTLSENSHNLPTVAVSEFNSNEDSQDVDKDHVIDDRGKTELGKINSLVENPYTNRAVSEIPCDSPSDKENQEPASKILMLPLISQPSDLSKKQADNRIEPLVDSLQPSIQPEKSECPLLKVSTQTTFSSLSSKKMGPAQPSLVGGRRDGNAIQSVKKLATLSLQHSKTPLRGELPPTQSQENCNVAKICGELGSAEGLQNGGKKMNDSSETQIKDMVKPKPAMMQRKLCMKDLDTLSMDINKKAAKNDENPATLASIPTMKKFPVKEHSSSIEGVPSIPGLKLTGLSRDSTKSPLQKDCISVRNSGRTSVLLQKTPPNIAHFSDIQKQACSTRSLKRMLEDRAANNIAHPSKRLSQSASTSRNLVETSEKALKIKVPSHSHLEDGRLKSPIDNRQITAIQVSHEVKTKGLDIYSIQNNSNIKLADAYSKELDDLCNMLRKKNDEAKEILARSIVNSNKLLMLNKPQFEERIRATQDLLSRLTINTIHG